MSTLRHVVASLVAVIALGLVLISLWPDRRYAPEWPYRLGLFDGRPTIERCERFPVRVVFFCDGVFDRANGVLDVDTDEDGLADVRAVIHHPGAEFYELVERVARGGLQSRRLSFELSLRGCGPGPTPG